MKWFSQMLVWVYALSSLYFLYTAALGIFVYFANKSLGHNESFLIPGRNLALGLIMGTFAFVGWKWMQNPGTYKIGLILTYLPFIAGVLFVLWFAVVFAGSGGRWN